MSVQDDIRRIIKEPFPQWFSIKGSYVAQHKKTGRIYHLPFSSPDELAEMIQKVVESPDYRYANCPRWQRTDLEQYNEVRLDFARKVTKLVTTEGYDYSRIISDLGKYECPYEADIMGCHELAGIAAAICAPPPRARGRPKARKEYPIEERRRN